MREKLKTLGVEFKERDFLSDFWGKEFTIQKPKGKGTTQKMRAIDAL